MKRILVAYDGGDPAKRALDTAIELARAFHATVDVVSVVPYHPGRSPVDPWDDRELHAAELLEAKERLVAAGLSPQLYEPAGDPAKTIELIAREHEYDTIVLGSRGLTALERVLQGSVSEHVVTHTQSTVIVTH